MCLQTLEKFREEVNNTWIICHGPTMAKIGDEVICLKWVMTRTWDEIKWKIFEVIWFDINSLEGGWLWFSRRIRIWWYPEESFNPNKFKKVD